jgi:hypothetical protein
MNPLLSPDCEVLMKEESIALPPSKIAKFLFLSWSSKLEELNEITFPTSINHRFE